MKIKAKLTCLNYFLKVIYFICSKGSSYIKENLIPVHGKIFVMCFIEIIFLMVLACLGFCRIFFPQIGADLHHSIRHKGITGLSAELRLA